MRFDGITVMLANINIQPQDFALGVFRVKRGTGNFGLLANLQKGKGLGVLADGDNGDQKQTNWVLQGTVTLDKLKLGLSVGELVTTAWANSPGEVSAGLKC